MSSYIDELPFISVITPSLNHAAFIGETIESVLQQNYPHYEHIIVDGGSTDDTLKVLCSYPHLRWISESDKGQSDAFNKGLAMISPESEIICWINSDDMLCPGALKVVGKYFAQNPDCCVLIGNLIHIDVAGIFLKRSIGIPITAEGLINGRENVQQASTFFRRHVFQDVGQLDTTLHYSMDHEFLIRALQRYPAIIVDADLAYFRFHSGSKTTNAPLGFMFENIKIRRRHGARLLSPGMLNLYYYILSELFRRIRPLRSLVRRLKGVDPGTILL